jgi:TPR repeat protein
MHCLGICLKNGQGVTRDLQKGVQLIRQAAEANHPGAMREYARCLRAGEGVPRDPELAAHYERCAAALQP